MIHKLMMIITYCSERAFLENSVNTLVFVVCGEFVHVSVKEIAVSNSLCLNIEVNKIVVNTDTFLRSLRSIFCDQRIWMV